MEIKDIENVVKNLKEKTQSLWRLLWHRFQNKGSSSFRVGN